MRSVMLSIPSLYLMFSKMLPCLSLLFFHYSRHFPTLEYIISFNIFQLSISSPAQGDHFYTAPGRSLAPVPAFTDLDVALEASISTSCNGLMV